MSRVLLLITGLNQGGAESQVIQLCLKLKNNGNDVQLVTMVNPVQSIASLEAAGIEVFSLAMRPGFPDPRAIWRFALCIRKFQPDVVHSHMVHANLLARISRLFTRMPKLICTAHNMNEGGRLREWLYRVSDPLCNMTTNVSEDAVQRYIQIKAAPSNKILYMPNGVDLQHFADRHMITAQEKMELRSLRMQWNASDQFIWLAVGRLVPEKDYAMMLSSFKRVVGYDNKALLLIVGEGPEHDKLRRLVQENGLESFVVFLGIRQDIPNLMKLADGFVLSSQWEGLPMVLLEASASALPIVATNVGGNREIVKHGVNGYLCSSGDIESLADAMLYCMKQSGEARKEMGQAGRTHVLERYDLEQVVKQWEHYYAGRA